jgi:GNAT superfamily N-acetyltransferase
MKIRSATAADAAEIAEVFVAGQGLWAEEGDAAAAMAPPAITGDEMVAEDDDGIVGFAIIKGCEVDLLFTHPRAWGQGAGRALIVAAEDALREATCAEVSLWTEERNSRARRVLQASRWSKTKELREREWNDAPLRELRYRKRL